MDCEMVGCLEIHLPHTLQHRLTLGGGATLSTPMKPRSKKKKKPQFSELSVAGKCTVVDYSGVILFDEFINPEMKICNPRTKYSGIQRKDLYSAMPLREAQINISQLLDQAVLVGHAIKNDLDSLFLSHPKDAIRDTCRCLPLRRMAGLPEGQVPSLKKLTQSLLGQVIQVGPHSSLEDAMSTLHLYKLVEEDWEGTAMLHSCWPYVTYMLALCYIQVAVGLMLHTCCCWPHVTLLALCYIHVAVGLMLHTCCCWPHVTYMLLLALCYIHVAVGLMLHTCCCWPYVTYMLLLALCYIHVAVGLMLHTCCCWPYVTYMLLLALCYIHVAVGLMLYTCWPYVTYMLLALCYIHVAVGLMLHTCCCWPYVTYNMVLLALCYIHVAVGLMLHTCWPYVTYMLLLVLCYIHVAVGLMLLLALYYIHVAVGLMLHTCCWPYVTYMVLLALCYIHVGVGLMLHTCCWLHIHCM